MGDVSRFPMLNQSLSWAAYAMHLSHQHAAVIACLSKTVCFDIAEKSDLNEHRSYFGFCNLNLAYHVGFDLSLRGVLN